MNRMTTLISFLILLPGLFVMAGTKILPETQPAEKVVLDWQFGKTAGSVVPDASGKGRNGVIATVPLPVAVQGETGRGVEWITPLQSGGVNVVLAGDRFLPDAGSLTVECRLLLREPPAEDIDIVTGPGFMFRLRKDGSLAGYVKLIHPKGHWSDWTGVGRSIGPAVTVPLNGWCRIAYTYSAENRTVTLFFNGKAVDACVLDGFSDYHIQPSGKTVSFGGRGFAGAVEEVRITNAVRTSF